MTPKTFLLLLIFFSFCGFKETEPYRITAGIGADELQVGKTPLETAISMFGDNFIYHENDYRTDSLFYDRNFYIYDKLGITLIAFSYPSMVLNPTDSVIDNIIFREPAMAETSDGIMLGRDGRSQIVAKMGQTKDSVMEKSVVYFHYRQKGISFGIDRESGIISAIEVYRQNGYPEFGSWENNSAITSQAKLPGWPCGNYSGHYTNSRPFGGTPEILLLKNHVARYYMDYWPVDVTDLWEGRWEMRGDSLMVTRLAEEINSVTYPKRLEKPLVSKFIFMSKTSFSGIEEIKGAVVYKKY
jgi:hypothetical protein